MPSGIVTTGWPSVRDTCRYKLGVEFDDWQDGAGRLILGKRADGKLAVMIGGVGMSVCRQVGKTYLIAGLTFGLAVNRPGMLWIWSAHHSKTHNETFLAMQSFAKRLRVAPYVDKVYTGSGDEAVVFRNGSRILFGARERGFGRGIPGVDGIISDEAQIMSEKARDAQLATMNTSAFGLAIDIGTPPRPDDQSEMFKMMRTEAWAGILQDAAWIEIGAAPGTDPNDRRLWPVWNPSHPHRTPVESILRLQRKLGPESFKREGMGMWDEDGGDVFGGGWQRCADESAPVPTRPVLGIAVSIDQKWASVGVAGDLEGGKVGLGANRHEPGTDWVVGHVAEIQKRLRCAVVIDAGGPGAFLIPDLERAGVRLTLAKTRDVIDACSMLAKRVAELLVVHPDDPELNAAVKAAVKRLIGDGGWAWGRRKSTGDISMLEAVTLAAWEVWRRNDYNVLDSAW